MTRPLLADETLERSPVVANCLMNREREIIGSNSYTVELRFDPLGFLTERLDRQEHAAWLDRRQCRPELYRPGRRRLVLRTY